MNEKERTSGTIAGDAPLANGIAGSWTECGVSCFSVRGFFFPGFDGGSPSDREALRFFLASAGVLVGFSSLAAPLRVAERVAGIGGSPKMESLVLMALDTLNDDRSISELSEDRLETLRSSYH